MESLNIPIPQFCCPALSWPVPTVVKEIRAKTEGEKFDDGYRIDDTDVSVVFETSTNSKNTLKYPFKSP